MGQVLELKTCTDTSFAGLVYPSVNLNKNSQMIKKIANFELQMACDNIIII